MSGGASDQGQPDAAAASDQVKAEAGGAEDAVADQAPWSTDASYGQAQGQTPESEATTFSTEPRRRRRASGEPQWQQQAAQPAYDQAAYAQQQAAQPAYDPRRPTRSSSRPAQPAYDPGGLRAAAGRRSRPTTQAAYAQQQAAQPAYDPAAYAQQQRPTRSSSSRRSRPTTRRPTRSSRRPTRSSSRRRSRPTTRRPTRSSRRPTRSSRRPTRRHTGSSRTGSRPTRSRATTRRPTRQQQQAYGQQPYGQQPAQPYYDPSAYGQQPSYYDQQAYAQQQWQGYPPPTQPYAYAQPGQPPWPAEAPVLGHNRQVATVGPSRSSWPASCCSRGASSSRSAEASSCGWATWTSVVKDLTLSAETMDLVAEFNKQANRLRRAPAHPRHHAVHRWVGILAHRSWGRAFGVVLGLLGTILGIGLVISSVDLNSATRPSRAPSQTIRRRWVSPSSCSSAMPSSSWPCSWAGVTSGARASADRPPPAGTRDDPRTSGVVLCPRPLANRSVSTWSARTHPGWRIVDPSSRSSRPAIRPVGQSRPPVDHC